MSNESRRALRQLREMQKTKSAQDPNVIESLLDCMQDGSEYASIVDKKIKPGINLMNEIIIGIRAIEAVRNRPCLMYVGNVIAKDGSDAGVDPTDDLPFQEMVATVPTDQKAVDIFLATNGGSGAQIARFVNYLRPRFDEVNFLIPSFCMSAGTLFALSGERIYMTPNASLGPIDPQVPSVGGRYVPAQALLLLVSQLQKDGEEALKKTGTVPWTAVRLIDSIDKKELGDAITASQWSQNLAEQYIQQYKFKNWTVRETSQQAVTYEYKRDRSKEIATALVSHDRWKSHGHAISRDVLWDTIKLKIDHPDENLERAMRRLWAMLTWTFEKASIQKLICASNYRYTKIRVQQPARMPLP